MEFKELMGHYAQPGVVAGISVRPGRMENVKILSEVRAVTDRGLEGDRYRHDGKRQVTLIQQEHLLAIASFLGRDSLDYTLTRRNILVRGINLISLKGKNFKIGEAVLEYTGECHPCSRMEEVLGQGGYNAMRGHGGITAKIISGGIIKIGDGIAAI